MEIPNWANEFTNIIAILVGFVICYFFIKKRNKPWHKSLGLLFLCIGLLDIATYLIYKVYNQNSFYLTPFYIFFSFTLYSFSLVFSIENKYFKRVSMLLCLIFSLLILYHFIFNFTIDTYDPYIWLIWQIYLIISALINLYYLNMAKPMQLKKDVRFYFTWAFLIMGTVPLVSNFFQFSFLEISQKYFTLSLFILNLSSLFAYLLLAYAVRFLRHW